MPERQAMKKVSKTKRGSDGKRQERVAGIMKDKRGYMDLRGRKRWRERAREVEAGGNRYRGTEHLFHATQRYCE